MSVKVLITREFREDKRGDVDELVMKLRSMATLKKGYVSGETLISSDNPNKVVVISTWASPNRWQDWQSDSNRKEFTKELEQFLLAPEHVEVFLVGEKPPEWVDMA